MEEHAHTLVFNSLVIITVLAFIVPLIVEQIKGIRIPIVVGEIIAGIIIGKSGLNLIEPGPYMDFLSTFGLTYLMFLSGLEIDFDLLKKAAQQDASDNDNPVGRLTRNPVVIAILMFILTLIGAFFVSLQLQSMGLITSPYLMTLIISTTSLAVVVPVLKEHGIADTIYGQTILVATLIADFATMLLITAVAAIIQGGFSVEILLILVLFLAMSIFHRMGLLLRDSPIMQEIESATAQIRIRLAFALMLVFIGLAQQLGAEIILGAFLAGVIYSLLFGDRGTETQHRLEAFGYGFFIPIFFILVGVQFNLGALLGNPETLLLVALLLVAAYLLKLLPAFVLRTRFSWLESISAGFLMSSRLSLIIAAASIGLRIGAISDAINSAVILVALVSVTLSPILFDKLLPEVTKQECDCVVIVGASRQAALLAQRLRDHQENVFMIDNDPVKVRGGRKSDFVVVHGDATDPEDLERASADRARTLVAMTGNDEVNEKACELAQQEFGIGNTIALVNNPGNVDRMSEKGIATVSAELSTLMAIDQLVRHPASQRVLAEEDKLRIADVQMNNPAMENRQVRHASFPGDSLVVAIIRENEKIVPHGNTVLKLGDTLSVLGTREELNEAQRLFEWMY